MNIPGHQTLHRWDKGNRELFLRALLTIVVTLVLALVVLFVVLWIHAHFSNGGHPYLPREIREKIIIRSFGDMAVVMFVAFAIAAVRISQLVVRHVRRREGERLARDLQLAHDIQTGSLPQKFPPFPERNEFDIFATMRPAREVGGDFYDFYFVGKDRFVFLVADVSGKGVPAALFMMRAKSLLKAHIQTGIPLAEAVSDVNEVLCEENAAALFVTVWIAMLDVTTGRLVYVNAGHNPPLRRCPNARRADYVRDEPCLILGALSGVHYRSRQLQLQPGESLYLYTDGITEQVNERLELFGERRLRELVGGTRGTQKDLLDYVSRNVVRFAGAAEQTDDRTQLELVWRGRPVRRLHEYAPTMEAVAQAATDLERDLGDIPSETKMTILAAADEIFVNIVRHSGATKWSLAVERVAFPDEVRLVFTDDGTPFDPLLFKDPDTALAIEDRPTGGLGIYIVKKTMSSIFYARRFEQNILILGKTFETSAEVIKLLEKALSKRKVERRT